MHLSEKWGAHQRSKHEVTAIICIAMQNDPDRIQQIRYVHSNMQKRNGRNRTQHHWILGTHVLNRLLRNMHPNRRNHTPSQMHGEQKRNPWNNIKWATSPWGANVPSECGRYLANNYIPYLKFIEPPWCSSSWNTGQARKTCSITP